MTDIRLPDGSRLVLGFRKDPGARYWHAPDFDAVLRAFRGWSQDYFFTRNLLKTIDSPLGRPPDDEDLFRRVAHAVVSGHLAWELPAPLVLTGGAGGPTTSSGGSSPPPSKTESKPQSKSAPPPSSPSAPPPKPTTPPSLKSAPPTPPKPPPSPKPSVPPVSPKAAPPPLTVNVKAGVSVGGIPKDPNCEHHWVQGKDTPIPQRIASLNNLAARLGRKKSPAKLSNARSTAFEAKAIQANLAKMGIHAVNVKFKCSKCNQDGEVDCWGKDRVAEAKSEKLQQAIDADREQTKRLLSLQKQLFPGSSLRPLAKLDSDPSLTRDPEDPTKSLKERYEQIWTRRGLDVEWV